MTRILDDHVHVNGGLGQGVKNAGGSAGLVWQAPHGDLGLILVERDAADDDVLHAGSFFFHDGTGIVVETGTDFEDDVELLGELDRAQLHHLGSSARHLKHLIVGDLGNLAGRWDQTRIGRVDAIDICVNLAEVGLQRSGQGDGRQIRTPTTQSGDVAVAGATLETGHDHHVAFVESLVNLVGRDVLDTGFGMGAVGHDARLGSSERNSLLSLGLEGDGHQRDGLLLARGQ